MTTKRRALGTDPLSVVIPTEVTPTPATTQPATKRRRGPSKVRATFHIPEDVYEECRDAVWELSGPPLRLTLADLAERALRTELERLKTEHNQGRDFPPRAGELKGGRPLGS